MSLSIGLPISLSIYLYLSIKEEMNTQFLVGLCSLYYVTQLILMVQRRVTLEL